MDSKEVIKRLKSLADPKNVQAMARFGISTRRTLGISVVTLRVIAKDALRELRRRTL